MPWASLLFDPPMKTLLFPEFFRDFDPDLKKQIDAACGFLRREYGARCRIVGGAVRDRLLGRRVKDVDLEIYGIDPKSFEEAMRRLGARGVGQSFFVYLLGDLDLALPRRERKVAPGHRGFAVEPAYDEREASRRRDFTVNALLYDLEDQTVHDYWGGLKDLSLRRLRAVDPLTFREDSLRVLRAMRFAAQLGFRVEEETCRICREIPLGDLPGSRIYGEFEKFFIASFPHYGLYELLRLQIARRLWGETMGYEAFVALARKMARVIPSSPESLRLFCFLAQYRQYSGVSMERILDTIDAPRRMRKALENLPEVPEHISAAFVAEQAKREGLNHSALGCFPDIRRKAKELGLWEKPLEIGVTPAELMARGFRSKALGEELERLRRKKIEAMELAEQSSRRDG